MVTELLLIGPECVFKVLFSAVAVGIDLEAFVVFIITSFPLSVG